MSPSDLITDKNGKLVLTKLQVVTFHALLAATVAAITTIRLWKFLHSELPDYPNLFDASMWALYSAVAVGHAVIDRTGTQIAEFKGRKLSAATGPSTVTKTSTETETRREQ